jgi:HlyD family secretion protein
MKRSTDRMAVGHAHRHKVASLAWVLLALAPLCATGCGSHATAKSGESGNESTHVSVVHVQRGTLTRFIEQPGYLKAYETTPIYTKIAGFAEEPKVDIGDKVKKDETLVKIWIPEVLTDLKVKAARVEQAKADVHQAQENEKACKATVEAMRARILEAEAGILKCQSDVERWKAEEVRGEKLLKQGIFDKATLDEIINQRKVSEASEKEARAKRDAVKGTFDESQARYGKSKADVDVAQRHQEVTDAEYQQWKDWVAYADLKAPYDGIITLRNVHTGHFLQPSMSGSTSKSAEPLFCVMRYDIMRVTIQVPETDAAVVKKGDEAKIRLQALPGQIIKGTVTRFTWSLDEKARTLKVEVHVKNPKEEMRPGMYANVILTAKVPDAQMLPPEAVLTDGDKSYCYEVVNGKVRRVDVEQGLVGEEGVQVLRKRLPGAKSHWEDFTGQENFVASNPAALLEGQAVEVGPANTAH